MTDQVEETPVDDHKQGALLAFRRALPLMNPRGFELGRSQVIDAVLTDICVALKESALGLRARKTDTVYVFGRGELLAGLKQDAYLAGGAVVVEPRESSLLVKHENGSFEVDLDYDPGLRLLTVKRVIDAREPQQPKTGTRNVGEVLAGIIVERLAKA